MQGLDAAKYSSALDCARQLTKSEGPGVFLRGLVPRLGRVVPGQGIIFMSFESIQNKLCEVML
jgi:solute carrier family 25 citrate transporter 1